MKKKLANLRKLSDRAGAMIYLICYDWLSTRGNHAGMSHLCDMLVGRYADIYALKKFCLPLQVEGISSSTGTKYTQSKKSDIEQLQYLRNNLLQIATNESNEWYQNGWYRSCAGSVRIWKAILLRIIIFLRHS